MAKLELQIRFPNLEDEKLNLTLGLVCRDEKLLEKWPLLCNSHHVVNNQKKLICSVRINLGIAGCCFNQCSAQPFEPFFNIRFCIRCPVSRHSQGLENF